MKTPASAKILTALLGLVSAIDVISLVLMPAYLNRALAMFYINYPPEYRVPLMLTLGTVGLVGLWILLELIVMLRTMGRDPFVVRNVRALRRIGAAAVVAAMAFGAKCLFNATLLTALCGCILLIAALVAFTLAHLFVRAVAFKEENDLTI